MDTLIWTVTNLIANIILPPTVFFCLIAIGLWLGGNRRWARWLAGVSLAAPVLLSVSAVSRRSGATSGAGRVGWRAFRPTASVPKRPIARPRCPGVTVVCINVLAVAMAFATCRSR